MQRPDPRGYFGSFGGRFVPEVLVGALEALDDEMRSAFADAGFWREYEQTLARTGRQAEGHA